MTGPTQDFACSPRAAREPPPRPAVDVGADIGALEDWLPAPGLTGTAWKVCCRASRPASLEAQMLVLGLAHAVRSGAVAAAADGHLAGDALVAARLFAALQLKVRGGMIDLSSRVRLGRLVPLLPATWQRAMEAQMARVLARARNSHAR